MPKINLLIGFLLLIPTNSAVTKAETAKTVGSKVDNWTLAVMGLLALGSKTVSCSDSDKLTGVIHLENLDGNIVNICQLVDMKRPSLSIDTFKNPDTNILDLESLGELNAVAELIYLVLATNNRFLNTLLKDTARLEYGEVLRSYKGKMDEDDMVAFIEANKKEILTMVSDFDLKELDLDDLIEIKRKILKFYTLKYIKEEILCGQINSNASNHIQNQKVLQNVISILQMLRDPEKQNTLICRLIRDQTKNFTVQVPHPTKSYGVVSMSLKKEQLNELISLAIHCCQNLLVLRPKTSIMLYCSTITTLRNGLIVEHKYLKTSYPFMRLIPTGSNPNLQSNYEIPLVITFLEFRKPKVLAKLRELRSYNTYYNTWNDNHWT